MDNRPDPKPRKNAELWQAYLIYSEFEFLGVKHANRRAAITAGKSNFSMDMELILLDMVNIDQIKKEWLKVMSNYGQLIPAWEWLISIKGIGEGLAAKLLAQIDDIGKFDTVSKLWKYSGYAVIDGQAQKGIPGEQGSGGNKRLKSVCFLIVEQFIRQQTPVYADLYYAEKERQRELHPEKIIVNGKTKYNDGHIHAMAMRKVAKIFLQHLWVVWRTLEGLPVTDPYIHAIGGHSHYVAPPNFEPVHD